MRIPAGETVFPETLAKTMFGRISERVRQSSKRLCLAGVLASDDVGSHQYAVWTQETCQAIGVDFCLVQISPWNVATYIKALNTNPCIHGIIVYYPIFGDERDDDIKTLVSHTKDVEGLNRWPLRNSPEVTEARGQPCLGPTLVPCTPKAVEAILQWLAIHDPNLPTRDQLNKWEICIINRSDVVGLPLAQMLAGQGARVYSVDVAGVQLFYRVNHPWGSGRVERMHSDLTLREAVRASRVIISAVPHPAFKVETKWLQVGAICVNVSSAKNFEPDVLDIASKFVPRIGNVTIASLLENLLLCARQG
ncbi:methylenetetrahydrofolate dehydrogenase [Penicillium macrosclerotiorum]|uniref:methylenetetrahydrofolate dehydrogenase n=1 Tax=Penicillium macrosclerotiorum TaxID=303699 RepID=UPI002548E34E|nr:methylenetetrahydrofolate dehydrogenase [Penicillium macrosclerotiorum]KAJ5678758.1 methylenetetrahydrofolate dehydrogenase [Penicillium macrosclerotiorum]